MNKSGKYFWLILSILFAVGSIAAGTIYDSNRKKSLEVQTVSKTVTTTNIEEKENTAKKTDSHSTEDTKNNEESSDDQKLTESQLAEVQNAQSLIDVIIVSGQVQTNFTLDDYRAAKSAVDALQDSSEKTDLNEKITQIETALTNMGISY